MSKPKISVLIPSYNSIAYYDECLRSVLRQSLQELEILCIDADSTDGTKELIQKYAQQDARVKLIISDKKSYGYQLNLGFKAARGEYVGIVESDDYIKKTMYERLYQRAKEGDYDAVKCDFYIFTKDRSDYCKVSHFDELYQGGHCPLENLKLFYTEGINQIGIYRLDLLGINQILCHESPGASYQDNGLFFQLFAFAKRVSFLPEALYMLRRDNPNSSIFAKDKVFAHALEYDFIRAFLARHKDIEKILAPICAYHRFGNYCFTLNRIDARFKRDFLRRFGEDFAKIIQAKELQESLYTSEQLSMIRQIVEDSDAYYFSQIKTLEHTQSRRGAALRVQAQLSYRLGEELFRTRSFFRALSLPFRLVKTLADFYFDRRIYRALCRIDPSFTLPPLESYADYEEALAFQNHLKYKFGRALVKNPLLFPLRAKKIYKAHKKGLSKKVDGVILALSDEEFWVRRHEKIFGYKADFKQPKTFNEKLIHRMLYDRSVFYTFLADKLKMRLFVANTLGDLGWDLFAKNSLWHKDIGSLEQFLFATNACAFLPKLYGIYRDIADIDFSLLPESFVLKTNHDCGGYVIVEDKQEFMRNTKRFSEGLQKLKKHLETNYYPIFREWHYKDIEPRIFAEELLRDGDGKILDTYKFHIFDQENLQNNYIQVTTDRFKDYQRAMMTASWHLAPFNFIYNNAAVKKIPAKPLSFDAMMQLSLKLARPFDYVRVDLYQDGEKIYVGELTFTHGAASERLVCNDDKDWDAELGKLWQLKRLVDAGQ
ncbi:ATP-grasp fold amidoligase family protein [Campylobacter sp.]|uniref:ATP-grasp fold amidoligase family protein n=1 Tax=Campylobacter sp. TaxID=205 RepID=UPI0026DA8FD2|nr:ATP-grasp fold amidoligase family protein [Campylobacter sp.]MDO4674679.1 ATP-grasp fold amidoligase family protein [Campylobacter sp.]